MSGQPPRELGGYRLEGLLGRGGMGAVYAATHLASGAAAALKVTQLRDPRQRARFLREQQLLERAQVTGVVRILGSGEAGPFQFVAMERLRGQSLEARLQAGPLPPGEARALAAELAGTLAACHARGILHRDLKPANVFLTAAGPKLIDFGLGFDAGLAESRLTQTGAFLGTPGFWAPEQAGGSPQEQGVGVDVYGVGAVLYACLTQSPPHGGSTLQQIMQEVARAPAPPSALSPGVPAELDRVCLRCLAADPRERYASMQALEADLRGPRPAAVGGRPGRPGWWLGLGALTLAALGLGGVVWALQGRTRPEVSPTPEEVEAAAPSEGEVAVLELEQRIERLYDLATEHANAGNTEEALTALDEALGLAPDSCRLWTRRAWVLSDAGRLEEAQDAFAQAVASDEQAHEPYLLLAHVARTQGNLEGSLFAWGEAIQRAPQRADSFASRAATLVQLERPEEALEDLRRAIARAPEEPRYRVHEVRVLEGLGLAEEALEACDRGLAACPDHGPLYARRAALHTRFERFAAALADANRTIELAGESPDMLRIRGFALVKLKRYAEGLQDVERALESKPGVPSTLGLRAEALLRLQRYPEAVDACNAALAANDGRFPRLWSLQIQGMRGEALWHLGRHQEAVADFEPMLQARPNDTHYLFLRGVSQVNLQRFPEGVADLERCLELDPGHSETRLRLATAFVFQGRLQEALDYCDRVLEERPDSAGGHFTRGLALYGFERFEDAAQAFSQAIRLSPKLGDSYGQRAQCRVALGRYREAVEDFDRALELGVPEPRAGVYRAEREKAARLAAGE